MTDNYQWLEEVEGEQPLAWVKERSRKTCAELETHPDYQEFFAGSLEIYNDKDKIPYVWMEDDGVYNLWKDEGQVQGLLRRSTSESYAGENPAWETIIDLDALSEKDGRKWVFHGLAKLDGEQRALLALSDGGKDADVIREFDLQAKAFVADGYALPESKGGAQWAGANTLLVSRDFGAGTLTESGYPRMVREWTRGTPLADAKTVFEIPVKAIFAQVYLDHEAEPAARVFGQANTFYESEYFLEDKGRLRKIDVPPKTELWKIHRHQLIMTLKTDWKNFRSGDMISVDVAGLRAGATRAALIHSPAANESIEAVKPCKSALLAVINEDIKARLYRFEWRADCWERSLVEMPDNGSMELLETDYRRDDYYVNFESYLVPSSLYYCDPSGKKSVVKKQRARFDTDGIIAEQLFAVSRDGTRVPYTMIRKQGLILDGSNPVIQYGYGGFEISLNPGFGNVRGRHWLERGGVFVVANIRGGGEYGPAWHQSVLKFKRHLAYQDFFAVSEDLIARKVTCPERLGVMGGSNGGLLMGVCLTQRPDLYRAIVAAVPLLDMLRYHKLLAGASWVAEYGDPEKEDERAYLESYSPYHVLKRDRAYPKIFFQTSTKDDRVHPGHARKMAARMEEYGHDFFYYENTDGGHSAAANLRESAKRDALTFSYFWGLLS